MKEVLYNWGLYPKIECDQIQSADYEALVDFVKNNKAIIARGNGRCYGDASLASKVISTLPFHKIIHFDSQQGIFTCQSGVLLDNILQLIVPEGFFLPVTPGTKFITVGGALASDIHGKNHHVDGVFSDHVLSFKLLLPSGDITDVFPGEDLFDQTAGGLGRTGIVLELQFRLKKIETTYIRQTAMRAKDLAEIFSLFEQHKTATYSVAWIDCLASGQHLGRSVLLLGEHAKAADIPGTKKLLQLHARPFLNVPFMFPSWVLNPLFIRIFNLLYYFKPSSKGQQVVHYDPYFYPLDKVENWNRIYGKKGFVQYQFVMPKDRSFKGIKEVLEILSENNLGSFLAVLKLFGKSHENRYLHFPMEGHTLALDIKISERIWPVLDQLDDIVTRYGGKVYLTKDARLRHKNYEAQYQQKTTANDTFQSYQMARLEKQKEHVFLVLGANSDIAKAAAIEYTKQYPKGHLILASRNVKSLATFVADHQLEAVSDIRYFDATDLRSHREFVQQLPHQPHWILYAAGVLATNEDCFQQPDSWIENVQVNFTGAVSILNALVSDSNPFLEKVIGLSSIAGLRGRKSNFMYGAAKSGFHQYLFGLRQELRSRGVVVQAVTPGSVKTKMTQHLQLPSSANTARDIADVIVNAKSRSFELYPGFFWRLVAIMVRILPESIIKKM